VIETESTEAVSATPLEAAANAAPNPALLISVGVHVVPQRSLLPPNEADAGEVGHAAPAERFAA